MLNKIKRPKSAKCASCRERFRVKAKGRVPTYCSQSCKQMGYLRRKLLGPMPLLLLRKDIATVQVRDAIRREVWSIMQQAGLVLPQRPVPPPPRTKSKPALRIVTSQPPEPPSPPQPPE